MVSAQTGIPTVSVVVPVYNKLPFLSEAIDSILAQSRKPDEIIIVDDESVDGSADFVAELPRRFPFAPIRVFFKTHSGVADTRNYAIHRTTSEFVITLDADDIMHPAFIEQALTLAQSQAADVVYGDAEIFGIRSDHWCPAPFDADVMRYQNLVPSFAMIRRSAWQSAGGYPIGIPFLEDWSFFIRLAMRGARFVKLAGIYFRYRQSSESLCNKYILDYWPQSQSLITIVHPELFTFEEISKALECLQTMPDSWQTIFESQVRLAPRSHIPYLMLALASAKNILQKDMQGFIHRARIFGNGQPWIEAMCDIVGKAEFAGTATIPPISLRDMSNRFLDKRV